MKLIAIHQIEYTTRDGENKTAEPGSAFDVHADIAELLLRNNNARRLTADEIELDKLRAMRARNAPTEDEGEEGGDEGGETGETAETTAPAKTSGRKSGRKSDQESY